jgi:hypothetical protein
MVEPFRWKICFADVLSNRNGQMAQSYIQDIVEPSLTAMEAHISRMRGRKGDPIAAFGIGPSEELLRATLTGYCLSIQAMWEKQIRGYLKSCAQELKAHPDVADTIPTADWKLVDSIFNQLRGVPLTAFEEYPALNKLQLLGNVCRHGSGPSLDRLVSVHPELWALEPNPRFAPPPSPGLPLDPVCAAENLLVPIDLLKSFAAAIDSFWREIHYIYKESLEPRPEPLERLLVEERRMRAGRGRPWDPPANNVELDFPLSATKNS